MYLATVIDTYSRKLAGYALADHMRGSLVIDALAHGHGVRGSLDGAIFHSNHGSVYTSQAFRESVTEIEVFLNRSHDSRKLCFHIIRLFLPHRGKPQRINDSRRSSKFSVTLYLRLLGDTTLHNAHNSA